LEVCIRLKEEIHEEDFDIIYREFVLCNEKGGEEEERVVRQLQFVGWPDHGVPGSVDTVMSLRKRMLECLAKGSEQGLNGPSIIHCR
jgi:protein tyrosine phosphatase